MTYLDEAKADFEHSQGDVSIEYNATLKEWAKIKALIAIAEQLEQLNKLLENVTNYSGSAININKWGE